MTEKKPPTVDELLEEVQKSLEGLWKPDADGFAKPEKQQAEVQASDEKAALDRQTEYSKLKAYQSHHLNKGRWSTFIMFAMAGMIGFQSVLLGLVGSGVWDFSKYQWLLPSLLVQNLAQVITLAAIIVKALFDKHKD